MDFILLLASRFSGVVGKILKYSEHAIYIVSFAAVIRVVTQCSSGEEHCVTTLITAAKETSYLHGTALLSAFNFG